MAYFELLYYVWDNSNPGVTYKLGAKEAKEMVLSGRGSLWDHSLQQKVDTPEEWLVEPKTETQVDEPMLNKKVSRKPRTEIIADLQTKYKEKHGKDVPNAYKNNKDWIASKL